jgi:hypothetical protein
VRECNVFLESHKGATGEEAAGTGAGSGHGRYTSKGCGQAGAKGYDYSGRRKLGKHTSSCKNKAYRWVMREKICEKRAPPHPDLPSTDTAVKSVPHYICRQSCTDAIAALTPSRAGPSHGVIAPTRRTCARAHAGKTGPVSLVLPSSTALVPSNRLLALAVGRPPYNQTLSPCSASPSCERGRGTRSTPMRAHPTRTRAPPEHLGLPCGSRISATRARAARPTPTPAPPPLPPRWRLYHAHNAYCSMLNAQCSMRNAQCAMLNACVAWRAGQAPGRCALRALLLWHYCKPDYSL